MVVVSFQKCVLQIKPCSLFQTKESLKKFLQSMVSKSGKLRALVRDLKKSYEESAIQKFPDRNLQHDISSHKIYPNIWIYFQRSGNHDDSHFFVQ